MSHEPYLAASSRYDSMVYRRCGRSGLDLPAFDLGITHIDLANNYGPPAGAAEDNFGRLLASDLRPYRDELVISTKAGYGMWPGRSGDWGSRKYPRASLDQSLTRLGLD